MSARFRRDERYCRALQMQDLPLLMAIEVRAYTHPWTEGVFRDCLRVGYGCWALIADEIFTGYAVTSVAVGECHILNLTVAPESQGRGLGRYLLREVLCAATKAGADTAFLEVRPSNAAARHLYVSEGFNEVGTRRNYYPGGKGGREDALVMAKTL
ncbi:ribosomal protein S18-alanine N-acetyltransferase [Acidihalobacter ferrooxydans]|uniref:[Ribosomal protein bS18]-alanine N-acetyltransferase n=1 Tax=Acidihalobacter ferrooxydans TaxID=1765967 RepID=A0A1P8UDZ1_9GAMM|nr:ribosomal protein S18-alanine N-acetyltransferase [Acidihalobacter ferrooxydans]APZ42081.1 ribosomal-protein-alanine N-acetyltransferase [Acidihalobacter ferrooxydans]